MEIIITKAKTIENARFTFIRSHLVLFFVVYFACLLVLFAISSIITNFLHRSGYIYWLKHTDCVRLRCGMKTRAVCFLHFNEMKITIKHEQYKTLDYSTTMKQSSFAFDAVISVLVKNYKKIRCRVNVSVQMSISLHSLSREMVYNH